MDKPLSTILSLVAQGASERALQAEFRRNLAALGAAWAIPANEYIVFSDFPVGNGIVDFAIFTCRSKMHVILVEIKGANFDFVNARGAVAADINLAAQQIRERFHQIQSSYEPFRRQAHVIRGEVEKGKRRYGSVMGPNGYLHVDPEKDIYVRGAVIGGRTRDDYEESRIRHQLTLATPHTSFDSWTSWLRRIIPAADNPYLRR